MSTLIEETVIEANTRQGDPAHIVNCPDGWESTETWLAFARANTVPVESLCGVVFILKRDPFGLTVCQACMDAANIIVAEVANE